MIIGRHVAGEVPLGSEAGGTTPALRLRWLRRWIAELERPELTDNARSWFVYATLFRVEALLQPDEPLRSELAGMFEASLREPAPATAARLLALAARDDAQLLSSLQGHGEPGDAPAVTPLDITRNVDVLGSVAYLDQSEQALAAGPAGLYGPTWLLAFRAMDAGLAELLSLPLRVVDHAFFVEAGADEGLVQAETGAIDPAGVEAALTRAVASCRESHPGVRIDGDTLDLTSPGAFALSFAAALLAADFDPDAAPAGDLADAPDWQAVEDRLVGEAVVALERFSEAHPDEAVTFVAFDASPFDGAFSVCFDTTADAELRARASARALVADRQRQWSRPAPDAWKTSRSRAIELMPEDYEPDVSEWEHHLFHDIDCDWEAFVASDAYARLNQGGEEGWMEGHLRLVLAAVCDRLADSEALQALRRAPMVRLGYQYPGDKLVVCHILWD